MGAVEESEIGVLTAPLLTSVVYGVCDHKAFPSPSSEGSSTRLTPSIASSNPQTRHHDFQVFMGPHNDFYFPHQMLL